MIFVLQQTPIDVVFGNNFIISGGIVIYLPNNGYYYHDNPSETIGFKLLPRTCLNAMLTSSCNTVEPSEAHRQTMIAELLQQFDEVIGPNHKVGRCGLIKHSIKLCGQPKKRLRPYKYAPPLEEEINRQIAELKANGMVRPSNSDFAAPIVLVAKAETNKKRLS